jgi:hypothetical protein
MCAGKLTKLVIVCILGKADAANLQKYKTICQHMPVIWNFYFAAKSM